MITVRFANRQQAVAVDTRRLRRLTVAAIRLLEGRAPRTRYTLGVTLVNARRMARLNRQFLRHDGPTDVLTFDHGPPDAAVAEAPCTYAEIFLCPEVARAASRRFRTPLPTELLRYVVHGLLHLRGFDDHTAAARRRMKRLENRLVRALVARAATDPTPPQ
jgi:probable rRNA maturation factor